MRSTDNTKGRRQSRKRRKGAEIDTLLLDCRYHIARWEWLPVETARSLTKVLDLSNDGFSLDRVFDGIEINSALICDMNESIESCDGLPPPLFEAKNQVCPLMKTPAHILTFKCLTINPDETTGVAFRPLRQSDVMNCLSGLSSTEVKVVVVHQELGEIKELGDELSNILQVLCAGTLPTTSNVMEQAVGNIKASTLKRKRKTREWLQSHQIIQHICSA
mmetsp:Transcript_27294/g.59731  ORF Transcript_27294/g.59731 Transcript_27294/m.59731 type:complete len:219 (-) Transcript_27294:9802-10458(-)